MFYSFLKASLLLSAASFAIAQDQGAGFIFQCDNPGVFALTFDDGPSEYTGTLLATLREKAVKATFFSVGTEAAKLDIAKYLKQAHEEGHQIASHTNTHADLNTLTVEQIESEMLLTEKAIQEATGLVPAVMRPPYGNCGQQCQSVMKEMDYLVVQWNIDSNDWQFMDMPDQWETLVSNILSPVNSSDIQTQSFISLQHDIHQFSVERTGVIIDGIKAKGYEFQTVNECLGNRFPMYKNMANPSAANQTATSTAHSSTATPSTSLAISSSSNSSHLKPADNTQASMADIAQNQASSSSVVAPISVLGLTVSALVVRSQF